MFAVNYASECKTSKIDLVFLLDGSGSIGKNNFKKVLNWVLSLVKKFYEKKVSLNVGVIVYRYEFIFDGLLSNYNSKVVLFKLCYVVWINIIDIVH